MTHRTETLQTLFESNGTLLKVKKGQPLYHEGDSADDLFFVKEGQVRISKETEDGKELTIRICSQDSLIGEVSLFCETAYYAMTAVPLSNTSIYSLSRRKLEELLTKNPTVMIEWVRFVQLQSRKNQSMFRDLLLHGKKGALFSTLIRFTNTHGSVLEDGSIRITQHLTNHDLASFCATSREVVNRMLADLKKRGVLSVDKGLITVHDLQFLKDEIHCENCPLEICRID